MKAGLYRPQDGFTVRGEEGDTKLGKQEVRQNRRTANGPLPRFELEAV